MRKLVVMPVDIPSGCNAEEGDVEREVGALCVGVNESMTAPKMCAKRVATVVRFLKMQCVTAVLLG